MKRNLSEAKSISEGIEKEQSSCATCRRQKPRNISGGNEKEQISCQPAEGRNLNSRKVKGRNLNCQRQKKI
jgi:hypothetical protein